MTAHRLGLSTWLLARLRGILAIAWTMAVLLASVRATFKRFAANTATTRIRQPTRDTWDSFPRPYDNCAVSEDGRTVSDVHTEKSTVAAGSHKARAGTKQTGRSYMRSLRKSLPCRCCKVLCDKVLDTYAARISAYGHKSECIYVRPPHLHHLGEDGI
ncbi:hypothetical protein ETB97_003718 [Aspergillus alliaceus]|uniref:Uncharacterized protein n=1 Tax=Petromyces alliaceus TaxID=209559 RepID=A0A8H6AFH7_PETAA|nr:hypothetical protein ETB97_003718 [Aspergillus burnettii]